MAQPNSLKLPRTNETTPLLQASASNLPDHGSTQCATQGHGEDIEPQAEERGTCGDGYADDEAASIKSRRGEFVNSPRIAVAVLTIGKWPISIINLVRLLGTINRLMLNKKATL
jgi:hypothetical protein